MSNSIRFYTSTSLEPDVSAIDQGSFVFSKVGNTAKLFIKDPLAAENPQAIEIGGGTPSNITANDIKTSTFRAGSVTSGTDGEYLVHGVKVDDGGTTLAATTDKSININQVTNEATNTAISIPVSGAVTISAANVDGDLKVGGTNGDRAVFGSSSIQLKKNTSVDGNLSTTGTLTTTGAVTFQGGGAEGSSFTSSTVKIHTAVGNATGQDASVFLGSTKVAGNLYVTGDLTVNGSSYGTISYDNLNVKNVFTVKGDNDNDNVLLVHKDSSVGSNDRTIYLNSNTSVGSGYSLTSPTLNTSALNIGSSSTSSPYSSIATFDSSSIQFKKPTTIDKATTISGTLIASGDYGINTTTLKIGSSSTYDSIATFESSSIQLKQPTTASGINTTTLQIGTASDYDSIATFGTDSTSGGAFTAGIQLKQSVNIASGSTLSTPTLLVDADAYLKAVDIGTLSGNIYSVAHFGSNSIDLRQDVSVGDGTTSRDLNVYGSITAGSSGISTTGNITASGSVTATGALNGATASIGYSGAVATFDSTNGIKLKKDVDIGDSSTGKNLHVYGDITAERKVILQPVAAIGNYSWDVNTRKLSFNTPNDGVWMLKLKAAGTQPSGYPDEFVTLFYANKAGNTLTISQDITGEHKLYISSSFESTQLTKITVANVQTSAYTGNDYYLTGAIFLLSAQGVS